MMMISCEALLFIILTIHLSKEVFSLFFFFEDGYLIRGRKNLRKQIKQAIDIY
jgi:hypothetical protein